MPLEQSAHLPSNKLKKSSKVRVISDVRITRSEPALKKRSLEAHHPPKKLLKKCITDVETDPIVIEDASQSEKQKIVSPITEDRLSPDLLEVSSKEKVTTTDAVIVEDSPNPEVHKKATLVVTVAQVHTSYQGTSRIPFAENELDECLKQKNVLPNDSGNGPAPIFPNKSTDKHITEPDLTIIAHKQNQPSSSDTDSDVTFIDNAPTCHSQEKIQGITKKSTTDTDSDVMIVEGNSENDVIYLEDTYRSDKQDKVSLFDSDPDLTFIEDPSASCVRREPTSRDDQNQDVPQNISTVVFTESTKTNKQKKASRTEAEGIQPPGCSGGSSGNQPIQSDIITIEDTSRPDAQNRPSLDTEAALSFDLTDSDNVVILEDSTERNSLSVQLERLEEHLTTSDHQDSVVFRRSDSSGITKKTKSAISTNPKQGSIRVASFAAHSSQSTKVAAPKIIVTPASPVTFVASPPGRPMPAATPRSTLAPPNQSPFVRLTRLPTAITSQQATPFRGPSPVMRFMPFAAPVPPYHFQQRWVPGQGIPSQMNALHRIPFRTPMPRPFMPGSSTDPALLRAMSMSRRPQ
ncbi:unnamed protein product [Acanthoscelides obtectus]|uniref:Uncharacterized protein n=1 Tax=Acanthoscelides obtectus TaxID=200917 RepID=A0A9P0P0R9_ACAOB|nr:unnamed protein product [Acanthoscelides obtectus]CAK1669712.1 hypothetical protein AOBTE_LOCUS27196 [Acanthoscelides obtectus]